jgi:hypothetical protein
MTAAIIAGAVAVFVLWANGLRVERARRREMYAKALELTYAYREFAYAVPRRRHELEHRAAERVRISEAMRDVQRDLMRYESLLHIERARRVYVTYRALVAQSRKVAGGYIRAAWERPPITEDREVNVYKPLDFSAIDPFTDDYLDAVATDLAWWRFWR